MTGQVFRSTWVPPTRWVRFKRAMSGLFMHPMVQLAIVTFWVVCIAVVIVVVLTEGWLL